VVPTWEKICQQTTQAEADNKPLGENDVNDLLCGGKTSSRFGLVEYIGLAVAVREFIAHDWCFSQYDRREESTFRKHMKQENEMRKRRITISAIRFISASSPPSGLAVRGSLGRLIAEPEPPPERCAVSAGIPVTGSSYKHCEREIDSMRRVMNLAERR
jgi:hypothetical protein